MRRLILGIALLSVACSGGDPSRDETTTSSTTTPTTTSTTTKTSSTTTTTTVPATILIFPTTNFGAGQTYEGTLLFGDVRYRLQFPSDGWEVEVIGQDRQQFVHIINTRSGGPGVEVGVVVFMGNDAPGDVASFFEGHESIAESTVPTRTSVAGFTATTLDVRIEPGPSGGIQARSPCLERLFLTDELVQDQTRWAEQILGCAWSRIWVIDVDGVTVTVYGSRWFEELDPESIAELEPVEALLDEFINAITFCTEATPCEG